MRALAILGFLAGSLAPAAAGCNPSSKGGDTAAAAPTGGEDSGGSGVIDADGDGYPTDTDCDDTDPSVNPGAEEIPYNGVSDDCNPATPDDDLDGDGYGIAEDCDDEDPDTWPGATEVCDGADNDCDGEVDDSTGDTWYADADGDGYGDPGRSTLSCDGESGWVADDTDCDDTRADVNPGADEVCDEADNDCDGEVDEGALTTWYRDADGDGYGDPDIAFASCTAPSSYVADGTDCDDTRADVNPGADELCDDIDNDCDDLIDDEDDAVADPTTWYRDADGDAYGDPDVTTTACERPDGYRYNDRDCDDDRDDVNPGATEVCDGVDNDCDGLVDDEDEDVADAGTWYTDGDGDGYGDADSAVVACEQPSGSIAVGGDCDDGDDAVNPDAAEVCGDGLDNDCDGSMNGCGLEGDVDLWSADGQIIGESRYDYAGRSLSTAGDFDGDGSPDLVIGAYYESSAATGAGSAYVVGTPLSGITRLEDATVRLSGESANDYAGLAVSGGADADGDGLDDLLIGAYGDDDGDVNAGAAYLVTGPLTGSLSLSRATAKLVGERANDYAGYAVALLPDTDGDGYADLLVGASGADTGGTSTGTAYLVRGPVTGAMDLIAADAEIIGENSGDYAGRAVAAAGDVDGDGLADLLIGAHGQDDGGKDAGAAYIVLGPASGGFALDEADARLLGPADGGYAGYALAAAGDVNGDGHADVIVGAPYDSTVGVQAGAAYLALGPFSGDETLGADAALYGEGAGDFAGMDVAGGGDVDGDGFDDLAVGAYGNDENGSGAGAAYVVYGPASGSLDLAAADVRLYGERAGDYAGRAVAIPGDLDEDGYDDVLVAAPWEDTGGTYAGSVYVLFGGGF